MFLFAGKLFNKVKAGTQFEIESIHAVAAVKGTQYATFVDDNMDIWVEEGSVEIKNDYGTVLAEKNTHTEVTKDSAPSSNTVLPESLPKAPSLTTDIGLVVSIPGPLIENKAFSIRVVVKDIAENRTYTKPIKLKIGSGKGLKFSSDGSNWQESLSFEPSDGLALIQVLSKAGSFPLIVSGENVQTISKEVWVQPEKKEKIVVIEFSDKSDSVRKLTLKFIKK